MEATAVVEQDERASGPVAAALPRVLFVDDEPSVLAGLRRQLRHHAAVDTASGVDAALTLVRGSEPFAVVVTDMRMPGKDGVVLLEQLRVLAPDTVRVLLTGYADIDTAIAAVNDGNVFRFLCKPCETPVLLGAIRAAVEQHRLLTAERDLLERTLRGSVSALLETLSLANPIAFARGVRVRELVRQLLDRLGIEDRWQIEVASMLCQVGAVALPPGTNEKVHRGMLLDGAEQAMVDRLPALAAGLLEGIPRLDEVVAIVRCLESADGDDPLGTRILRVALDYDWLDARGLDLAQVMDVMKARKRRYDPVVLAALAATRGTELSLDRIVEVPLHGLEPGMTLAEDITAAGGALLVGRGTEVTPTLLERIGNLAARHQIDTPIGVVVRAGR